MSGVLPGKQIPSSAETLSEKLFEFSPDAIFVTDAGGRITNANAQVERLFGYKRDELLGQPVELLIPERFRQVHPTHRARYGAEPRVRPMGMGLELLGRRKDGTEFPVDIMLSPVESAPEPLVLCVVRDITERKSAERVLRQSEQELRSLFEYSPDVIVVSDQDGRIVRANAQVERAFGYPRGELLGQPVDMLVPERYRNVHPQHRENYGKHPRVRSMGAGLELFGRRKDGTEFPVDIMLGPVEGPDGRLILSVIRDLSEKKEAEEALRRSEQEKRYLEKNSLLRINLKKS